MQMVYNPELLQTGKCDVLPVCTLFLPFLIVLLINDY
jgi:hypothetical protein